jgi:DnaK suppressor protein
VIQLGDTNEQYPRDQSTRLDRRDLERFRESLQVERACFESRMAEAESAIGRQHSGSADDAEVRSDLDVAVAQAAAARRALAEVSEALGRLESGMFGLCARCREPIPKERLEALPRARFCVHCE